MNVQKFTANTSREAWRLVRDALGADAVILSNRTVNGMVEILALASEDMSYLSPPAQEKETVPEAALSSFNTNNRRIDSDQAASLASALETARIASQTMQAPANELT